jgi:hypothetical protein
MEQENTNMKAHKMMRGRVEPSTVLMMVRESSTIIHATKRTVEIPHMTTP